MAAHPSAKPGRIILRSNCGHYAFEGEVNEIAQGAWVITVVLRGVRWAGNELPETLLTAGEVVVRRNLLMNMTAKLRAWANLLPLVDQDRKALLDRFVLIDEKGTHLELCFGPRKDLIPSGSNPTVTVKYEFGRLAGEFPFVTDQTCLRIFCDHIDSFPATST